MPARVWLTLLTFCIARLYSPGHAHGDQYRATDILVKEPGKLELVFTPQSGADKTTLEVYDFQGAGQGLAMYNTVESVRGFAHASFKMACK